MAERRPIDIKRDAATTLHIGGEDKSAAQEFLSTAGNLYIIKETGVFKVRLADFPYTSSLVSDASQK